MNFITVGMQPLSEAEFERLSAAAEVLEQDAHGPKVLRLPDGNMLKLFRVKRRWSSACISPYSKRFCRNALRLARLQVPTLTVMSCYRLARPGWSAVLYRPLAGDTLRQIARAGGLNQGLLEKLGAFVAGLHDKGIYFRSLHLGNIVLTPAGDLGLIDIADLSIKPWPLFCGQRLRNFRHLCRLQEDRLQIGQDGWQLIVAAYMNSIGKSAFCSNFSVKAQDLMNIPLEND